MDQHPQPRRRRRIGRQQLDQMAAQKAGPAGDQDRVLHDVVFGFLFHGTDFSRGRRTGRVRTAIGPSAAPVPRRAHGVDVQRRRQPVAQVLDGALGERRHQPPGLLLRQPGDQRRQPVRRQERRERHRQVARARDRRPLRQRLEAARDVRRQDAHLGPQREVTQAGQELGQLAGHRPRPLGEDDQAAPALEHLQRLLHGFADGAAPLHRDQVREVLEVGAPVAAAEEVIGGGHRRQVLARVAQRHLDRAHVQVRGVVGGHDEAGVVRDVNPALHLRLQHALVEQALPERQGALAGRGDLRRHVDVAVVVRAARPPARVRPRRGRAPAALAARRPCPAS